MFFCYYYVSLCLPILLLAMNFSICTSQPNMLAVDPPRQVLMTNAFGISDPFRLPLNSGAVVVVGSMGLSCTNNATCLSSNGYCSNGTCECLPNFVNDPNFRSCKLAPGYNEPCEESGLCREAFVCNSSKLCDCPEGFLEEYLQCVRDCPKGELPINGSCLSGVELNLPCQRSEQCVQTYSECLTNGSGESKCQCIPGAEEHAGSCLPVNQCPIGSILKSSNGTARKCAVSELNACGASAYCMFAELNDQTGYCCPKPAMKCPIGTPMSDHNCTSCPWDTHHCFSFVIGSYSDSMCCPNACPSSQPIQKEGKCYARSAFGAHCTIKDQCYSVVGSLCREDESGESRCLCPPGPFFAEFGQCLRKSFLNETCRFVRECHGNTQCVDETCICLTGWIAAPDGKTCIPSPSCPVPSVQSPHHDTSDTSVSVDFCDSTNENKEADCPENHFCHPWWTSIGGGIDGGDKVFAHCCPKPKPKDFDLLCRPYSLTLMMEDEEPKRCDLSGFQTPRQPNVLDDASDFNATTAVCPPGAACLFDPFTVTKGVCCEPIKVQKSNITVTRVTKPDGVTNDGERKNQNSNKDVREDKIETGKKLEDVKSSVEVVKRVNEKEMEKRGNERSGAKREKGAVVTNAQEAAGLEIGQIENVRE